MKKIIFFLMLTSASVFFSCNDQVDPKEGFKETYILNCILRSDTSYQMATVTRSYNVDGYDPLTNKTDPAITGAVIKVTYDKDSYEFRDTSVARTDTSRYHTPIQFYYTNKLKPVNSGTVKIEAKLPDGKILTAEAQSFSQNQIYFEATGQTIPPKSVFQNSVSFAWQKRLVSDNLAETYFAPELSVLYSVTKNGAVTRMQKKVPMIFLNTSQGMEPVYPPIRSNITSVFFAEDAIEQVFREISEGDPAKSDYKIEKAIFRLLVIDRNLAAYYSSQQTYLDEFSVRVNQPDFTNIVGGRGIFGTYMIKTLDVEIDAGYARSFGYGYGK